ncbi:hypothetical protein Mgra_00005281 [Meloidogyne graminicola]|uniref:Uncharacterized protein n=1 Tax=Meloidogyne graminicola TaxID=189291 RepID=A0A8S9ZQ35_9BILA|nr:hypothetical protein Mgra_00005281 [Meloidogyne graminicola]
MVRQIKGSDDYPTKISSPKDYESTPKRKKKEKRKRSSERKMNRKRLTKTPSDESTTSSEEGNDEKERRRRKKQKRNRERSDSRHRKHRYSSRHRSRSSSSSSHSPKWSRKSREREMDRLRPIHYFSLIIIFFLLTLGPKAIFAILFVFIAFIIGLIFCLIKDGLDRRLTMNNQFEEALHSFNFLKGLPFVIEQTNRFTDSSVYNERHSMTNSQVLDPILEQTLVDWVPLLTRHFVDDFASHLRLYRKASERLQFLNEAIASGEVINTPQSDDLESLFFDLELEMEQSYCRDLVSTSPAYESAYLHDISDILLYLLMPSEDFRCRPLRFLLREIFVTKIFVPLLDCLSEPSFVNRMIVWLLSELPLSTDDFVGCLERCKCVQELESILESVHEEICTLKSKCAGNVEHGNTFLDQLSSLEFTEKLIRRRMIFLVNKCESTEPTDDERVQHQLYKQMASLKKDFGNGNFEFAEEALSDGDGIIHLPISVVLANKTSLPYFIEFLNQAGGQNHIDCYLAIQGFKTSMEHQLQSTKNLDIDILETQREAALFIYRQYISQEAITRVPMSDSIINKFLARLRSSNPQSDFWFEQIEEKLINILRTEKHFFPSFKKHFLYTKMLKEMGIFGENDSINELTEELEIEDEDENEEEFVKKIKLNNEKNLLLNENDENKTIKKKKGRKKSLNKNNSFTLLTNASTSSLEENSVFIEMLGIGHQGRHLFALYNVRVNRANASSNVIRRYSDFHNLHNTILIKFPSLQSLSFPGKKTFNNLDRAFLEKRCYALNQYINYILQPNVLSENPGLEKLIFDFLSQKTYSNKESLISPKNMGKAMFNPIFRSVKAFGNAAVSMPSDLIDGIGKMGSELNRAATQILGGTSEKQKSVRNYHSYSTDSTGSLPESGRVAAHLDEKDFDNIPLRVLLLFVDEVFGLRAKNQWFRRRLVSLLRQFVNATMGNSINRRIVDAVNWLTSEEQVAQYLIAMRDSIWGGNTCNNDFSNGGGGGGGSFLIDRQQNNQNSNRQNNPQDGKQRTRFLARCLMLSAIPDQLRLFIGNTTIQLGIENVSEALQNRHLNRRFWYLIFERLLTTIFPHNHFDRLLPQLHSKSPRAQNKAFNINILIFLLQNECFSLTLFIFFFNLILCYMMNIPNRVKLEPKTELNESITNQQGQNSRRAIDAVQQNPMSEDQRMFWANIQHNNAPIRPFAKERVVNRADWNQWKSRKEKQLSKRQKQKFNKQTKKTLNQNGDQNQLQTNKQKSGQNNVGSSSTEKPKTRKEKKAEKVQKLTDDRLSLLRSSIIELLKYRKHFNNNESQLVNNPEYQQLSSSISNVLPALLRPKKFNRLAKKRFNFGILHEILKNAALLEPKIFAKLCGFYYKPIEENEQERKNLQLQVRVLWALSASVCIFAYANLNKRSKEECMSEVNELCKMAEDLKSNPGNFDCSALVDLLISWQMSFNAKYKVLSELAIFVFVERLNGNNFKQIMEALCNVDTNKSDGLEEEEEISDVEQDNEDDQNENDDEEEEAEEENGTRKEIKSEDCEVDEEGEVNSQVIQNARAALGDACFDEGQISDNSEDWNLDDDRLFALDNQLVDAFKKQSSKQKNEKLNGFKKRLIDMLTICFTVAKIDVALPSYLSTITMLCENKNVNKELVDCLGKIEKPLIRRKKECKFDSKQLTIFLSALIAPFEKGDNDSRLFSRHNQNLIFGAIRVLVCLSSNFKTQQFPPDVYQFISHLREICDNDKEENKKGKEFIKKLLFQLFNNFTNYFNEWFLPLCNDTINNKLILIKRLNSLHLLAYLINKKTLKFHQNGVSLLICKFAELFGTNNNLSNDNDAPKKKRIKKEIDDNEINSTSTIQSEDNSRTKLIYLAKFVQIFGKIVENVGDQKQKEFIKKTLNSAGIYDLEDSIEKTLGDEGMKAIVLQRRLAYNDINWNNDNNNNNKQRLKHPLNTYCKKYLEKIRGLLR